MKFLLLKILGVWNITEVILETQMARQMYALCEYVNNKWHKL
jgi:hypothetical protein